MFKRGLVFVFILMVALISCSKNTNFKEINKVYLNYEWFSFVKEKQIFIPNKAIVDSLVLYFMKEDVPEVIKHSKIIVWHKGKNVYNAEFDDYKRTSLNHFIFLRYRKKTFHISELYFREKFAVNDRHGIDITDVPCEEIEKAVLSTVTKDSIYTDIIIYDTCFDKNKKLRISIPQMK